MNEKGLIFFYGKESLLEINQPDEYKKLTDYEKNVLEQWINNNLVPYKIKNFNYSTPTSYGLKHIFHSNGGFYLSNGAFKGAMIACGFDPKNNHCTNPTYKIGKSYLKPLMKNSKSRSWRKLAS